MRTPVKDIGGLMLAVDPKKIDKHVVLDGANFIVDVNGPRSAFGTESSYRRFLANEFIYDVNLGGIIFYFAHDTTSSSCQVYTIDWPRRQFNYLFSIPQIHASETRKTFPWSKAYVNGTWYLNHLAFGIVAYDTITQEWSNVSTTIHTNLATNVIYGIAQAGGRAGYLTDTTLHWSAIDDATNVTPSVATGAGFQTLSLVGRPTKDSEYLGLFEVADGFITILKRGIMKSSLIDSINPFTHDVWSTKYIPLNQNCVTQIADGTYILLTKTGFWLTDGKEFSEWQPLMNEYLKSTEIPTFSLNQIGQVQIHYDEVKQWFFMSFSKTRNANYFTEAFVVYLPRNEWGRFNYTHVALVQIDEFGDGSKFNMGYISVDGNVKLFADSASNFELVPQVQSSVNTVENEVFYADEFYQHSTIIVDSIPRVASTWQMDALDSVHRQLTARGIQWPNSAAFYELNGVSQVISEIEKAKLDDPASTIAYAAAQVTYAKSELVVYGFIRQEIVQESLNAFVDVGVHRLDTLEFADQLTEVSAFFLGMEDSGNSSLSNEDYMAYTDTIIEDWLTAMPDSVEDWGFGVAPSSEYKNELTGTLDGFTQYADNKVVFEEAVRSGKTRMFVGACLGLYLRLKIEATDAGESFHLKDLEYDSFLAGRL